MKRASRHLGFVVAVFGLFATGGFLIGSMATCSAELRDAPDAEAGTCEIGPFVFCEAGAPTEESCVGDPPASDEAGVANPALGYPSGCIANFLDPSPDIRGECRVEHSCTCVITTETVDPTPPIADGGSADGGENDGGEDAAAPAPADAAVPGPTTTKRARWQCTSR